ncbi:MAG: MucR family transcriptional regulator [Deltaproteobacteria bacterium]|jgi:predicted transcriptional regulator|nr:MucR family transcriptional regulator [Deltaproteobacteria bacterium]
MGKSLTEMASEIVAAQATHAVMAADEMVAALKKTFDALKNIKTIEEGGPEADAPPIDPRKSIQRNYIINLEDGKKYKQLTTRTLAKFGLTPAEYRKKWGFSARQPLASKALSAKRRKTAKALGLGERLQKARKAKAAAAAKAKAKAPKKKAAPKKRKARRKKKKA